MSLKINFSSGESKFENAPEGQYIGLISKVIDKGTQPTFFKKQSSGNKRLFLFSFELHDLLNPNNKMKDGKPFSISINEVALSGDERSKLVKIVKSAIGFDKYKAMKQSGEALKLQELVGLPVALSVDHNTSGEKTYSNVNIQSISPIQPGVVVPKLINDPVYFSLEEDEFDSEVLSTLSDRLQEIVKASPEFKSLSKDNFDF